MKLSVKRTLVNGCLSLVVLSLAACKDDPTGPSLEDVRIQAEVTAVAVGDTTSLKATGTVVGGDDVSSPKVKWRSLDPKIATVNGSGIVTGAERGRARIVAESGGAADTVEIDVVPNRINVRTSTPCANPDYRDARVVATGRHSIVLADPKNPNGGFTNAEYREIAKTFDDRIHPVIAENFGLPADIDGNDRVLIYYTRAVNEMTPPGSSGYVAGFFFARDLFPKVGNQQMEGCSGSNEAEIFYLMVPDPSGEVNRNERSKDLVHRTTLGTIAHEMQHLTNASRRIFVNDAREYERTWLNEALSHIAEELVFYDVTGLGPRQNIGISQLRASRPYVDAYNAYQISNLGRLHEYFRAPERLAAYSDSAELGDRGAGWHYLRYIADRIPLADRNLWFGLVNSQIAGFANLAEVSGLDVGELVDYYRDWAITAYTDDLVATKDPRFQQPSWNNRSILTEIGLSPISPRRLQPGVSSTFTLIGGGSAYLTFEVEAGETAEIQLTELASTPSPGACTAETPTVALAVGEVFTPSAGEVETLCIESAATDAEYAVVVTNPDPDVDITRGRGLAVTGFGIRAASPPATTLIAATRSPRLGGLGLTGEEAGLYRDFSLDLQLRVMEQLELAPLLGMGGGRSPRAAALFQAVPGDASEPYLSLVRLR